MWVVAVCKRDIQVLMRQLVCEGTPYHGPREINI